MLLSRGRPLGQSTREALLLAFSLVSTLADVGLLPKILFLEPDFPDCCGDGSPGDQGHELQDGLLWKSASRSSKRSGGTEPEEMVHHRAQVC